MATRNYYWSLILLVACTTTGSRPNNQGNNSKLGEICQSFGTLLQAPDSAESLLLNFELTVEAQREVIEQRFRHDARSTGQFSLQLHDAVTVAEGLIVTAVRGEIDWYEPRDIVRHEQRLDIEIGPEGLMLCEGHPATADEIEAIYRGYLANPLESYSTVINLGWERPSRGQVEKLMNQLVRAYWSSMEGLATEFHGRSLCMLSSDHALVLSSERPFRIRVLSPVEPPPAPPSLTFPAGK